MAKQTKIDWNEPEYSPAHDFDKVPVIEGTLVRKGMITIRGKEVSFVVLKTAKEEETVWLGAVLKGSLEDRDPQPGDLIGIKYLGMEKSAAGFGYRNFGVRVIPKEVEE